ncbi:hypothetical protein [Halothiobacillus sp.]|uniref:hypothetical protein n=1 Tax=Halothiobacillus sp. TaxID=1891311 RepID=UPI002603AAFB|nr:hypothetical protein [Halothiobacillus sp.]
MSRAARQAGVLDDFGSGPVLVGTLQYQTPHLVPAFARFFFGPGSRFCRDAATAWRLLILVDVGKESVLLARLADLITGSALAVFTRYSK